MNEISSDLPDFRVHRAFSAARLDPRANTFMVTEMTKILSIFRRPRKAPVRRPADPTATFTPRDWADLPVYHPTSDR
jgi:hypothetical protein